MPGAHKFEYVSKCSQMYFEFQMQSDCCAKQIYIQGFQCPRFFFTYRVILIRREVSIRLCVRQCVHTLNFL